MTTVAQQISNLLYAHECVIIPNLGALVSTNVSAKLDTDKNLFLPPSKEIGFNRSLSHNDGLLISTLAQENGVSYGKAKIMVEEFVAAIMARVNNGDKAEIEKIGTLKKDALGYLQFVAETSEAYSTEAYGLSSFHFRPVVPIHKPVVENKRVRRLLQPVGIKQIAATVAMVVGLFAISQSVETPTHHSANILSIIQPSAAEAPQEEAIELKVEDFKVPSVEEAVPVEPDIYFLIAGSFKTESQAKRFLNTVHQQGESQAFVLASPNKRYRVAINGYNDKAVAVAELNAYRQKADFKTVWVLTQK